MAIDFNDISIEQKRSILQQRITQFAAEAYQHTLNRETCVRLEDQDGIASSDNALNVINTALAVHREELNSLPAPTEE